MNRSSGKFRETLATSLYHSKKMPSPKNELKKVNLINKDIAVVINRGKQTQKRARLQFS